MLLVECALLITYLIFLIVYAVGDKFKLQILIVQIVIVIKNDNERSHFKLFQFVLQSIHWYSSKNT